MVTKGIDCGRHLRGYDAVFQTCSQSMAARMVRHFNERQRGILTFPANFATEAVELGPRKDHRGPQLVLFSHVSEAPPDLLKWLLGTLHLRRVTLRVYWIDRTVPIAATWEQLVADISAHEIPKDAVIRIACHPRKLEVELGTALPATWAFDLQVFTHLLSVVHSEDGWRWGLTPAAWTYRQGDDFGPNGALTDVAGQAVLKLDEALHAAGIRQSALSDLGTVVDLGAAPGTWTRYLAKHAKCVMAVDPAQLHPEVLACPNVRHLCMLAEVALPVIADGLQGGKVDLLVSDMNMHPEEASNILAELFPCLKPGAHVLLTLKFSGHARDRKKSEDLLTAKYKDMLVDHRFIWLLSNTPCELTYIGRRAAADSLPVPSPLPVASAP